MSSYNRLTYPIAVLGYRAAYIHLCKHCKLDPNSNDVFHRVADFDDVKGRHFSRVLEIDGAAETREYHALKSAALSRIRNATRAAPSVRPELRG